jgi:nucleoid DNA-binding protein
MKNEFDLTDLSAAVAAKVSAPALTKDVVREVLETAFATIADGLVEHGGRVEFHGFGTLRLDLRAPDSGTLPDGTPWETPERNKIVFKPAPAFLRIIAERTGMPTY